MILYIVYSSTIHTATVTVSRATAAATAAAATVARTAWWVSTAAAAGEHRGPRSSYSPSPATVSPAVPGRSASSNARACHWPLVGRDA